MIDGLADQGPEWKQETPHGVPRSPRHSIFNKRWRDQQPYIPQQPSVLLNMKIS